MQLQAIEVIVHSDILGWAQVACYLKVSGIKSLRWTGKRIAANLRTL